jgi:hypothetical protein
MNSPKQLVVMSVSATTSMLHKDDQQALMTTLSLCKSRLRYSPFCSRFTIRDFPLNSGRVFGLTESVEGLFKTLVRHFYIRLQRD